MKLSWILVTLYLLSISLCSCASENKNEFPLYKNVARQENEDGWVFTFVYEYEKENVEPIAGLINCYFMGFNVRYRYAEGFSEKIQVEDKDGTTKTYNYQSGALIWGMSPETAADSAIIDKLLRNSTKEELLELNEDSIEFTSMDKDMFFRLMREALTGEPQAESMYLSDWERPSYAALAEKEFLDGYKFQVCFLSETGLIDVCYIDVLYQTGVEKIEYMQLSDLVDMGDASEKQIDCYHELQKIAALIEEQGTFLAGQDQYKDMRFDNVDMKRLNVMLFNLQKNDYMQYISDILQ